MSRLLSLLIGLTLIACGGLALLANTLNFVFAWPVFALWRWWPVSLMALSLFFLVPPFLKRGRPGLSGLFIPGGLLFTVGGLTLFASVTNHWGVWARLWPLLLLNLAFSFTLMALYMRNAWLLVPAIFIGLNGVVLQFCALTGLWGAWAVLWTVEPFAVGLTLLLTAFQTRKGTVFFVGLAFCGLASAAALGMVALFNGFGSIAVSLLALSLIALGFLLLLWNLRPARPRPTPVAS